MSWADADLAHPGARLEAAPAGSVPGAPRELTVVEVGSGQARLAWTAPASDGGRPIMKHQIRAKAGGSAFTAWFDIADSGAGGARATSYNNNSLYDHVEYIIEVRAVNAAGAGEASNRVTVTPRPTVSVADATVTEPGSGTTEMAFTVTLSGSNKRAGGDGGVHHRGRDGDGGGGL